MVGGVRTRYQWRSVDLPAGTWTCMYDGPIAEPDESGIVPCCPVAVDGWQCREILRQVVYDRRGVVGFREPRPTVCTGPQPHDLRPLGTTKLGWLPCDCGPTVRGHRTWACTACGRGAQPMTWPPCGKVSTATTAAAAQGCAPDAPRSPDGSGRSRPAAPPTPAAASSPHPEP